MLIKLEDYSDNESTLDCEGDSTTHAITEGTWTLVELDFDEGRDLATLTKENLGSNSSRERDPFPDLSFRLNVATFPEVLEAVRDFGDEGEYY